MNKKNVLLINPPLHFDNDLPHSLDVSVPPLGLLYLASYINHYSNSLNASVIDIGAEKISLSETLKRIKKQKPFVIGLTSMTPQLQGTVELAKCLKKSFPKVKIFLGGPHISADPGFINRFRVFDYAITGEAEKTFLDSLKKLVSGKKIPRIQSSEVIDNLDSIPFPDKELIDRNKYFKRESMMFSRGCPYNCYYCSRPSISKKVRYRSAENLIGEIKSVYKDCHGKIDFQDDTFTLDRKRVLDFCRKVIEQNLKLEWKCNSRIDLVDEELLATMKKAGCSLIHFGIEAGNEKIRKNIVKKGSFTNKQTVRVFAMCREKGIKVAGYFMIGHPTETKENLKQTEKLILGLRMNLLGLSIPTPFPGSALYDIARKRGIISSRIIDDFAQKKLGKGYVGNYPILVSENLLQKDVMKFMRDTNRKFYISAKILFQKFVDDLFHPQKLYLDLKDFIFLVSKGVSSRKPYINKE